MVVESEWRCHRVNHGGVRVVHLCGEADGGAITITETVGPGAAALVEDQGIFSVSLFFLYIWNSVVLITWK